MSGIEIILNSVETSVFNAINKTGFPISAEMISHKTGIDFYLVEEAILHMLEMRVIVQGPKGLPKRYIVRAEKSKDDTYKDSQVDETYD